MMKTNLEEKRCLLNAFSVIGAYCEKTEAISMESRQSMILYALEVVARPGSREIRVRMAPDGISIRNGRKMRHSHEETEQ